MSSTYFNPNRTSEYNISALQLPEFARDYLTHISVMEKKSAFTLRNYSLTLHTFLQWIVMRFGIDNNLTIDSSDVSSVPIQLLQDLTPSDITSFISYCRDVRGNGAAACSSKLSVLKSFFDYSVNDVGLLISDPTLGVSAPKIIKKPVKLMTGREALSLIQACNCGETPARDVCIATILLNCGLRITELVAINLADIEGNTLKIWGRNGHRDRWLALNQDCMTSIPLLLHFLTTLLISSSASFP